MTGQLFPKGTIVRFKVGPLTIYEDATVPGSRLRPMFEDDGHTLKLAYAGDEGIYVRQFEDTPEWHLVMINEGDVPVYAWHIETHPDYEEKNKALLTEALVADSEQYGEAKP